MRNAPISHLVLLLACLAAGFVSCGTGRGRDAAHASPDANAAPIGGHFDFSEHFDYSPLEIVPAVEGYALPLAENQVTGFTDVVSGLGLGPDAREFLLKHGFAVSGFGLIPRCEDVVTAYEALSRRQVPVMVTSGSLLHTYHVLFDDLLSAIEAEHLYDDVWSLSLGLFEGCRALYLEGGPANVDAENAGELRDAAKRDAAFLVVGLELLKPERIQVPQGGAARPGGEGNPKEFHPGDLEKYAFEVPDDIAGLVSAELELVRAHRGAAPSPLFIYKEDYSQYVPRGHYTTSEKLKNYFRAMMWFGRMAMLLKGTDQVSPGSTCTECEALLSEYDARIQTLGAMILSDMMTADSDLARAWGRTYRVTSFFVGFSDDLGPYEYVEAMNEVFAGPPPIYAYSPEAHGKLKAKLAEFRSPRIYGGTGDCSISPPFTPEQADKCLAKTRGLRLMGQRFVPDSYILSRLVAPHTGGFAGGDLPFTAFNVPGVGVVRVFPRGLDVMAVLGSSRARDILDNLGDTDYTGYDRAFSDIKTEIEAIEEEDWNQNLYWTWLWSLKALLSGGGPGYPAFMQTDEWKDRVLKIALASWAELRHDTILYVKQSYTPTLTALPPPPSAVGYVEPVPELYNRLLALTRMTRLGLASMGLLDQGRERGLQRLEDVLERLISISLNEIAGVPLTEDDGRYVGRFGDVLKDVVAGIDEKSRKTTLVADVHTDMNSGLVLEEGVGYVNVIVVAWKDGDRIQLAAGPELSYYEFKHPMADRLTDEAWREMLESDPPPAPAWLPDL